MADSVGGVVSAVGQKMGGGMTADGHIKDDGDDKRWKITDRKKSDIDGKVPKEGQV